jgi:hypothetical protein
VSKEPEDPGPYPYEPAAQGPFWAPTRIIALVLVVVIGVSAVGAGVYYHPVSPIPPLRVCNNGATNYPSCTTCSSGQTLVNGTCYSNCTNGATNPPYCNNGSNSTSKTGNGGSSNNGPFCMAFNFGEAEYSQNTTGWYITLYIQNYCSDRTLTVSPIYVNKTNQPSADPLHIYVNGTTFPGPWTLPAGYAPTPPFYTGPPPIHIVICMSCAGQVFIPCRIYWITAVVTGSGTSSGATTPQSRGYGWQC